MRPLLIVFGMCAVCSLMIAQQPRAENSHIKKILSEISKENMHTTVGKLVGFGTRHTLSDTISTTRGIGAARRWIKSEFEKYARASEGRMIVAFHESIVSPSARVPRPTSVVNVVATLKPAQPALRDRLIVVGGHYDSRAGDPMDTTNDAPGANDDGSGTALVLELARVFAKYRFEATIVFIAFAGEEQGLLGATRWAEDAREQGWNVEAVLNNDIVGSSKGGDGKTGASYVRIFSEAYSPLDTGMVFRSMNSLGLENDGHSRTLARYINEICITYVPDFEARMVYRRDRFLRGGDHSPFHQRGFAAVRFSVARENYDWQHQNVRVEDGKEYGDLPQFMDFDYAERVARLNAAVLASLALAPAPPNEVGIVTSRLEYQTTLRWKAAHEPDVAGYLVRSRATTSPIWEHSHFTPDTTVTLDLLKDDYIFGVQAVDRDGNPSLPVIPKPVR